ncbi:MAG: nickel-responsive transcriptional regulator NikR [Candidatus Bathyarchaeota archaeon]|nr:MAG: nickel-responsive transcriptional regulator NikR [Candidatus Bathyarchaeota archaeon]
MPVVSMSLTNDLLRKLDALIKDKSYSSRSEAIRDAIRNSLSEYELSRLERGRVAATITTISEYERRDVDERLMKLRHEFNELVTGNMHIHLGGNYCLEVFIAQGDVEDVINFISRVRSIRGVQQVKYTIVPILIARAL